MTLYEMLERTLYYGKVMIWTRNAFDQCLQLFDGEVEGARGDTDQVWWHLMSEVDQWICGNRVTLIYVKDDHYNELLEKQFRNSDKWTRENRPYKGSFEVERILRERKSE